MSGMAQNDIERAVHLPNTFSHPGHVGKAKHFGGGTVSRRVFCLL